MPLKIQAYKPVDYDMEKMGLYSPGLTESVKSLKRTVKNNCIAN